MAGRYNGAFKLTEARLKDSVKWYNNKVETNSVTFLEDLAVNVLDVDEDTITNWAKYATDKQWMAKQTPAQRKLVRSFSELIKKVKTNQKYFLKVKGLADKGNAMAIFLLKANHGLVETSRHELSGPDGKPIEYKPIEVMGSIDGPDEK